MKKNILLVFTTFFLITTACQPTGYPQPNQATNTSVASSTPTKTPMPTRSLSTLQPTATLNGTNIFDPTYVPKSHILQNRLHTSCIQVQSSLPNSANRKLNLVLYDTLQNNVTFTQTLPDGEKTMLTDAIRDSIYVSPNRQWLAYLRRIGPRKRQFELILQSADGKTQKEIGADVGEIGWVSDWINDDYIALALKSDNGDILPLIAFNPFTNQQKSLQTDFPYQWNLDSWEWEGGGRAKYSPDLRHVIYPSSDSVFGNGVPRDVLWDTAKQKEITAAMVGITGNLSETPEWSPNGQLFALNLRGYYTDILITTNIDGTATFMPDMLGLYPDAITRIHGWTWSPDSRFIAFWLQVYTNKTPVPNNENPLLEERLMVLDVESGDITDYCAYGKQSTSPIGRGFVDYAPIWSPDGKSLLIERDIQGIKGKSRLILLDLDQQMSYEIAEDVFPFGWMVSAP